MRIICPKCQTDYALDASQLAAEGTPVQCSACEQTFTVYPPGGPDRASRALTDPQRKATDAPSVADRPPVPSDRSPLAADRPPVPSDRSPVAADRPPATSERSMRGDESTVREPSRPGRRTPVATAPSPGLSPQGDLAARGRDDGASPRPSNSGVVPPPQTMASSGGRLFLAQGDRIYKVKDIATLQRWVVEKRILPSDRLSRDGKSWDVVSSVSELRPFFAVLEQLKTTKRALHEVKNSPSSQSMPAVQRAAPLVPPRAASTPIPSEAPTPVLPQDRPAQPLGEPRAPFDESSRAPAAAPERAVLGDDAGYVSASAATPNAPLDVREVGRRTTAVEQDHVDSFFGDHENLGPEPEEVPGDQPAEAMGSGDFVSTRPVPIEAPSPATAASAFDSPSGVASSEGGAATVPRGAHVTRSFPATPASKQVPRPGDLPTPETVEVATTRSGSEFAPSPPFDPWSEDGAIDLVRGPTSHLAIVGIVGILLAAGWYLLLGPGRDLVFGDPAGTKAQVVAAAPPDPVPPDPAPREPRQAPTEEPATAGLTTEADSPSAAPIRAAPAPTPAASAVEPTPAVAVRVPTKPDRAVSVPPSARPGPTAKVSAADALKDGDRARDRADFRGAAAAYERAIEVEPGNATAAVQLGWMLIELGQASRAAEAFKSASRLRPGSAESHYGLGLAYQELGRPADARAEYQRVIELEPDGRDAAEVKALLRRLE